jgi:mevalonate pyrophosphate decarboxylase
LKNILISLLLALIATSSSASQAPQETRAEIEALFQKLQAANCQFNRNGTWYSGVEAKVHLTKKLAYFENKNMIKSTEDFITHAASLSSSSGKAYLVKCGNTPATESKIWLQEQLKTMRSPK